MQARIFGVVVAIGLLGVTSACGVRTDIAASGGTDVCQTLAMARTDIDALPRRSTTPTVGDLRDRLTTIERTLWTAQQQTSGLARVLIANLHVTTAKAVGSMSDMSGSSAVDSLPRGLRNAPNRVKGGFDDAWDKLACT